MVQAQYISRPLHFIRPAGTSRGVLLHKPCWYILLSAEDGLKGIGEVSLIPGLSVEDPEEMDIKLDFICKLISRGEMDITQVLPSMPGVQFALETAGKDLETGGNKVLFPSDFTEGLAGIPTNGLIWMGEQEFLMQQIRDKVEAGFRVLKMKVGALDFLQEKEVLERIRADYGAKDLEIRLDANGAWSPEDARKKMDILSAFEIHSIEQPIAAGQVEAFAKLCSDPTIPVALDEELIGVTSPEAQLDLLQRINPRYIILKPGLLGGFFAAEQWISKAEKLNIGWWVTSALESNIGLNAIAQWTASLGVSLPQGLGTGSLYNNNIPSPLKMDGDSLWYRSDLSWDLKVFNLEL